MPKINREEYEVLKEAQGEGYKWIARNYNGALIIYTSKPMKNPNLYWDGFGKRMDDRLFQFIQWEDEEPHNIAELIEEYESEETEVKKDIEWLKETLEERIDTMAKFEDVSYSIGLKEAYQHTLLLINQLDEPETISEEWLEKHKRDGYDEYPSGAPVLLFDDVKGLLVTKREEADQAYKDGYEKGKEHATEKQSEETETVAGVLVDYLLASAKLKLALSMEVEEVEE